MAAFYQDFSIEQSADCSTLTFTDTSNFSDNDEDYTYSYFTTKTIGVYDSTNSLIGNLINVIDSTPVTFSLDKDRYLHIVYILQHDTDTPFTKISNVNLTCNVDLGYGKLVSESLNCKCNNCNSDTLFEIVQAELASNIYAQRANGTLAQETLDLANSYLQCSTKCNCN